MKQLLEYIIPNIVNHPDEVVITEDNHNGLTNISIQTHPEDVGRVIGKSGKVIKAIRQIARIIAIKKGIRVNIDVIDSGKPETQTASKDSNISDDLLEDITPNTSTEDSSTNLEEGEGIDLQTE